MHIFRLIASPVLLLGLLAFLVWGAFWGWRNLTAPLPTPEPTPCVEITVEAVTPANVSVRVFNGGFTSGLAYRQSQRLENAGFNIVRTGNTDERVTTTIIRGNQNDAEAIALVTSYFKDATFENDDRITGVVDVLVGSEFAGEGESPITEVAAESGSICVPPTPEPTPTVLTPEPTPTTEG